MFPCCDLYIFESFERILHYGNLLRNLFKEVSNFNLPMELGTYRSYLVDEAAVSLAKLGAPFLVFLATHLLIQEGRNLLEDERLRHCVEDIQNFAMPEQQDIDR